MSGKVFLDTSGWLAAINTRDSRHKDVVATYDDLIARRTLFVTSSLVIAEMHSLIVRERGSKAGCDLLDAVHADPVYRVVPVDRELESAATDRWLRKFDERFSLTDAVSFELMRVERISDALALDHHFEIAGYRIVPGQEKSSARRKR